MEGEHAEPKKRKAEEEKGAAQPDNRQYVLFWQRKVGQEAKSETVEYAPTPSGKDGTYDAFSDALKFKLPKSRVLSKICVYKAGPGPDDHWKMVCYAQKPPNSTKAQSKEVKLIVIDLRKTDYRIFYDCTLEAARLSGAGDQTFLFGDRKPTALDLYREVHDVARANGPWRRAKKEKGERPGTPGYNCQDFVNEVLKRLAKVPGFKEVK